MNVIIPSLILLIITSCSSETYKDYSVNLLRQVQKEEGGHFIISPYGIWSLMSTVAVGTSGESRTQLSNAFDYPEGDDEILKTFRNLISKVFGRQGSSNVSLKMKNFLFLDNNTFAINSEYEDLLKKFEVAENLLDFNDSKTVDVANAEIENFYGKLKNVLSANDFQESGMILTNIITYKGLWGLPFNVTETVSEPFYNEKYEKIGSVNMMYQRSPFPYAYMKNLSSRVLELPYGKSGLYSMLIVLPNLKSNIEDVFGKFADVSIKDILYKLKETEEEFDLDDIEVKLPRFKISTDLTLNYPLNGMGVYDIFESGKAYLDKMSDDNTVYVSKVVHKADIEVTEAGTEASAATIAYISNRMLPGQFFCNRPFFYFILEKTTATVLFGGIYSQPSEF